MKNTHLVVVAAVLLCVVGVFGVPRNVRVIQTDPNGNLLKDVGTILMDHLIPPVPPYADELVINTTIKYQEIVGFGAAITESAAYTFKLAGPAIQKVILDSFFGNGSSSNQLNLVRLVLGACDYSLTYHSYDDSIGDEALRNFSVAYDDDIIVPFIKRAFEQSGNTIKFVSSPWSPPAWMKTNNGFVNGGSVKPNYYPALANYFVKYITEYKNRGIPIWGVTPQNEPEYGPVSYPGCLYTAQEEATFIKTAFGPALTKSHPEVKIIAYDHNRDDVYDWARVLYADPDVAKYLWGIGFHWYADLPDYQNVLYTHNLAPTKGLLQTEASQDNLVQTDWERGESFAYDIINDLNVFAQGFIQWNIVLIDNGEGRYGPFEGLTFNKSIAQPSIVVKNGQLQVNPSYYFIGHFSRFIPAGSRRIGGFREFRTFGLYSTEFLTPKNQVVIVIQNMNNIQVDVKIMDSGNTAIAKVPPNGIVTLIYDKY